MTREKHHTMSTYMIGKNDRAGRLIPDYVKYSSEPDCWYWQQELENKKAVFRMAFYSLLNKLVNLIPLYRIFAKMSITKLS